MKVPYVLFTVLLLTGCGSDLFPPSPGNLSSNKPEPESTVSESIEEYDPYNGIGGFEEMSVVNVRVGGELVTCIVYRISTNGGGIDCDFEGAVAADK